MSKVRICTVIFILLFGVPKLFADWVQVSNGITQLNINDLTATGNYIFAGTNVTVTGGGVFRTSNNGNSWEQVYFTTTLSLASNNNFVYRGYQNGFSYSSNYGSNWVTPGGPSRWITALLADANFVYSGCFTPTVTTNRGVWISSNNGTNWQQTSLNDVNIYALTKSNNYFIAGGDGIYLSSNNGIDWITTLLTSCRELVSEASIIYAGSIVGVYKSTNSGINWIQTSLNNVTVRALSVDGENVFAGSFYVSTNSGLTWTNRSEGMSAFVNTLIIHNGYIFAGTDGYGVWRRPLSELVGINAISTNIPTVFDLKQNYPNPFNPDTKINFSIPKKNLVQLRIYDILGREVTELVNEEVSPGEYSVSWDATMYASGIYIYRFEAGDFTATKKMLLLK